MQGGREETQEPVSVGAGEAPPPPAKKKEKENTQLVENPKPFNDFASDFVHTIGRHMNPAEVDFLKNYVNERGVAPDDVHRFIGTVENAN